MESLEVATGLEEHEDDEYVSASCCPKVLMSINQSINQSTKFV